jgi:hypothetical protein
MRSKPQHFDEAFLRWFRERTEEAWRKYQTTTFEEFVASQVGGQDWQRGTRWLGRLSEQEIVTVEQHYQMRFPPDYRLFLQMLHSVDQPLVGARYSDEWKQAFLRTQRPIFQILGLTLYLRVC